MADLHKKGVAVRDFNKIKEYIIRFHPGREQPYTIWLNGHVVYFARTIKEARMYDPNYELDNA